MINVLFLDFFNNKIFTTSNKDNCSLNMDRLLEGLLILVVVCLIVNEILI